jgi:hypothetical protein
VAPATELLLDADSCDQRQPQPAVLAMLLDRRVQTGGPLDPNDGKVVFERSVSAWRRCWVRNEPLVDQGPAHIRQKLLAIVVPADRQQLAEEDREQLLPLTDDVRREWREGLRREQRQCAAVFAGGLL